MEVQAWGVFRDNSLVSTEKGLPEKDAVEQAVKLNKFNGAHATYIARAIPGRRVRIEDKKPDE